MLFGEGVMVRFKQVLLMVIGLLFLAAFPLFASELRLSEVNPKITKIEFKVDESSWNEVYLDSKQIEVSKGSEQLFIRQYKESSLVGRELVYNYDENQESWIYVGLNPPKKVEITLSPYVAVMFTNKTLKHMYSVNFGLGVESEFSFSFHKDLIFIFDFETKYAKSNNIWAKHFIIFGGDIGVGYRFHLANKFLLTPSLLYGIQLHHYVDALQDEPIYLSHILTMSLKAGYKLGLNMNVFITPNAQFMLDSSRNGFLFGLIAGVEFTL